MKALLTIVVLCIAAVTANAQLFEQAYLLESKKDIIAKMKEKTAWRSW